MNKFIFLDNPSDYTHERAFIIHISPTSEKLGLYIELSRKLFCLKDVEFDWNRISDYFFEKVDHIQEKQIVLIHENYFLTEGCIRQTYVEVLSNLMMSLIKFEKREVYSHIHQIEVVFPKLAEEEVRYHSKSYLLNLLESSYLRPDEKAGITEFLERMGWAE